MKNTRSAAAGITSDLVQEGFAVVPRVLDDTRCDLLASQVDFHAASGAGSRQLLEHSWCRVLAEELRRQPGFREVLPGNFLAVQCTLFDKSPTKNWLVSLHQGEGGCLFDEIGNLVEPTERPAVDGRTDMTSQGRRDATRSGPGCRRGVFRMVGEGGGDVCATASRGP